MDPVDDERDELRAVALQNARSILHARLRAEDELVRTNFELAERSDELARSISMLRATLEAATDAILVTDSRGRVSDHNERFLELWGVAADAPGLSDLAGVTELLAARVTEAALLRSMTQQIVARKPADSFDVLELRDGRTVERFTRVQVLGDQPVGRVWIFRDVTLRRKHDDAVQAGRALFAGIIDQSPVAILVVDEEMRVQHVNPTAQPIFGTLEELLGSDFTAVMRRIWPAALADDVVDRCRRTLSTGAPFHRRGSAGARTDHFDWELHELTMPDGRRGVACYFIDVSAHVRAQQALSESEHKVRATFAQAAVGIVLTRADGPFVEVNRKAAELLGYTADELRARDFVTVTHPDDRPATLENVRRLAAGEIPDFVLEKRYVRGDGSLLWSRTSVGLLRDESGRPQHFVAVLEDISRRRRAEEVVREHSERLQLALSVGDLGDWSWDAATDFVTLGARAFEILGRPPGRPLTWAAMHERIHEEDRERALASLAVALAAGADYDVEYRVRHPEGEVLWVAAKGRVHTRDGAATGMIGVVQDITERIRGEQDRKLLLEAERLARGQAERANLVKDEFLATLSHELRTPLNAIVGWCQLLRLRPHADEEVSQGLAIIDRNAKAQTQLIEDLLDMSRIVSGKLRLDVKRVDVGDVVKAAVASIRHSADARSIRLAIVVDPLAAPVRGDANRLQQCVWNLLSNAIKFTPKGGTIDVRVEHVGSHVEIVVRDDGEGIAPEFLPHVFERFRQADASTTRRHTGLGLGLSIVRSLVELHAGSVRAFSAGKDQGAEFCIELPVSAVDEPARDRAQAPPDDGEPDDDLSRELPSLNGVTVLAIDDEPDARVLVQRVLEDCGARVFVAASASDGLTIVRRERPDVVVSDIGMPDVDGYQLIARLRSLRAEDGGRTPAAALSALARAEDRARSLRAGFHAHLAKPVEPGELVALVARLARRH